MVKLKAEKNTLYTLIIFGIIIVILLSYAIYTGNMSTKKNGVELPNINRELVFPRDEGLHDELTEGWIVFMNLTGENRESYYITNAWGVSGTGNEVYHSITFSFSNKTSKVPWAVQYYEFTKKYSSNQSMDLNYTTEKGIFSMKRINPESDMKNAIYNIFLKVKGNKTFILQLSMTSRQNPIPIERNGTVKLGVLGTAYGYFQTELEITGTVNFEDYSGRVEGSAFLYHLWGYLRISTDYFMMKMKNNDLVLMRGYAPPDYNLVREYLYVIYDGRYTVFITYNNSHTIGMDVDMETGDYKDLAGETYTARIEDYFRDPSDPYGHRCLAKTWYIYSSYHNYTATVHPMLPPNYPPISTWREPMIGKDGNGWGWGFGELDRHRRTDIQFQDIRYKQTEIDNRKFLEIEASISDGIFLNNVTLYYNFSGERIHAPMYWDDVNHVWYVKIGPFDTGENVVFRIRVEDAAYSVRFSEEMSVTVT